MRQQGVVSNACEMQLIRKVGGNCRGNPERQNSTRGSHSTLQHSIVGATPGQIGGNASNSGFGPALDRPPVVDAALDKGAGVLIGDVRVATGIPRPENMAHKIAKDGVGSARVDEKKLGEVRSGDRWGEALEMIGRHPSSRQVARSEAFNNDVA